MTRKQWIALLALTLCAVPGAGVLAQKGGKKPGNPPKSAKTPKAAEAPAPIATVGKPVKDFKLDDLADEKDTLVSLASFKGKRPVVLFFMSEQCSVTWKYEKRVGDLVGQHGAKDVQFLGVRCSAADTTEGIVKWADARNFSMPILNDANGEMSSYFKIRQTPTFALIDKGGVLRYWGSFDDTPEEGEVAKKFLPKAIAAVMTNKPVADKTNPPFG